MEIFGFETLLILVTLTFLEIILGIDNVIFISLAVQKLPEKLRKKARYFGISLALIMRCAMLFALGWVMGLTKPAFTLFEIEFSYKNLILFFGGLFLVYTAFIEIMSDLKHNTKKEIEFKPQSTMRGAITQIMMIDLVFSVDSIITAIGVTDQIWIIITAVIISMGAMLFLSGKISNIIDQYPTLKILALAFIFMIGVILILGGLSINVSKNYLYFSLFFALIIEIINIKTSKR
ncbi:TerC family protein [Rickettsiales bacterium]|nr:TerC family protein [Rickettsiales bacterium]MDB2550854.1 TerC family protein [Rickettsiales bacterium]